MRSPICHLEKQIAAAPFSIAPEKETICEKYKDEFQISFSLVDERLFGIRVRPDEQSNHEVVLPIAALEYLWAFSHYCWVLTQEYAESQKADGSDFNCIGNKRLKESYDLLEWAKKNLVSTGIEQWPSIGPRPRHSPLSHGDDEHVASELFLCSLAWMLHHEIAHIVLKHPFVNTSLSLIEERQADEFATRWLLSELEENDPRLKKRSIGIAIAVLCLQSLEIDSAICLRNTHPAAYDRIFKNISTYKCGNEDLIEAICAVVIQFMFHGTGISANINGSSFSEILNDLLYDISRLES